MPTIIFSEAGCRRENLYPFTLTRHIQDIRTGILTIREKWERLLGMPSAALWQGNYLDTAASIKTGKAMPPGSYMYIAANLLPDAAILRQVKKLKEGEALVDGDGNIVIAKISEKHIGRNGKPVYTNTWPVAGEPLRLQYPWQIFQLNERALRQDFALLTVGRKSRPAGSSNSIINGKEVFIEPGAKIAHSIINASTGPVYIGKNAEVQEGCMIRGPFAMGESALLRMGAKIYGATTLGPYCMGGGEIKNSVLMGYCNKAHDGYLGDSVIGEWCNLGAGTSNSNIKNNCGEITYNNGSGLTMPAAGIKGGLLMGDHSKAAVNTMFNTGTVVGVCCNIFGNNAVPKYTGNFCWGSGSKAKYELKKAIKDIDNWKKLKGCSVTDADRKILKHIFDEY
jgi:UDP-N-acetylglucosamine diphosphorylase / glucose-1-phosphate thymidylyltransferase / UDP-N-acetylgalactosamine diphosphorylase / glucosamine-1-phosphate N-acetyltransferase / galactosamine-1-phosphate N-acetyltransferase